MNPTILHLIGYVTEVVAYVVLTLTGHDGTVVFGIAGGQAVGALIQKATTSYDPNTVAVSAPAVPKSTIK